MMVPVAGLRTSYPAIPWAPGALAVPKLVRDAAVVVGKAASSGPRDTVFFKYGA